MDNRLTVWFDRLGTALLLLLPLFLTHGRAVAEAILSSIAGLFLLRSAVGGGWDWLRTRWLMISLLWWAWLVVCSVHANLVQAVAMVRVPIFVSALEHWLCRPQRVRQWVMRLVRVATLYILAQEALQLSIGRNLFGYGRRPSGELTGPYDEPRAGPIVSRLLPPVLLPPVASAWARGGAGRAGALMMVVLGVAAVVLFGQRMPTLLTGLGLVVSAVLLPRLRVPVIVSLLAGGALIAATAFLAPPTFNRLVFLFSDQMAHWPDSPYGQLAARAAAIGAAHPWTGLGFDAFRTACMDPQYWHGWAEVLHGARGSSLTAPPPMTDMPAVWRWLNARGGGYAICAQHPHNHYLQALEETGVPGLCLFSAMVLSWLRALGRGLWRQPDALRVGLFATVLIQEWPVASTSSFINMPLGGWFLLLLGIGMAEARWSRAGGAPISSTGAKEARI